MIRNDTIFEAALAKLGTRPAAVLNATRLPYIDHVKPYLVAHNRSPAGYGVGPDDMLVPWDVAVRAYEGTSWTPEKRAANTLRDAAASLRKQVAHIEDAGVDTEDVDAYRRGYVDRLRRWLGSRHGLVSAFIAGPSKFPARQMDRRNQTADKALNEFLDYQKRQVSRLVKQADEKAAREAAAARARAQAEAAETEAEAARLEARAELIDRGAQAGMDSAEIDNQRAKLAMLEGLQERMKAANKIIRRKKLSDDDKVEALVALGIKPTSARALLEPDFAGRIGYPAYALSNNNANIKRVKERIADLEAREGRHDQRFEFDGGEIELDADENRLRLHFDSKPDADLRRQLKSRGFRWSRLHMAWQRQWTDSALQAAKQVVGELTASEGT